MVPIHFIYRKLRGIKRRISKYPDIVSKDQYQIFESLKKVPKKYFKSEYVVQKFLPERSGENFIVRECYFLGDHFYLNVESSPIPLFTTGTQIEFGPVTPPKEIVEIRNELHLDYGKIDYAICNGETVIFDVNKTVGTISDQSIGAGKVAKYLAPAIEQFLN